MPKRKSPDLNPQKPIDKFSDKKRKRGRPRIAHYTDLWGHAGNYRIGLSQVWPELCGPLLRSQRVEDVIKAFEDHAKTYAQEFVPRLASDIFKLIKEPKFPQRAEAQTKYIAESVAGRPNVSMRRSRDICGNMRAEQRAKSTYRIIRKEFYVVCECGYKGPAEYDACRKCGAQISHLPAIPSGSRLV